MNASSQSDCPFCQLPAERIQASNEHALAVEDAFPVSHGHALIIVRRHVASLLDVTTEELAALHELLSRMRERLARTIRPDGFNIGINDGVAAGQTVMHLHIHLIPRFAGDVAEPRGGVRNVIPGKGPYG